MPRRLLFDTENGLQSSSHVADRQNGSDRQGTPPSSPSSFRREHQRKLTFLWRGGGGGEGCANTNLFFIYGLMVY